MAINRGVLGAQTGSMGGITASNWKGKNVYKQKVPATNSSNSTAQAVQRRKFAALARLAGLFGPAIRQGFRTAAVSMTEQNIFQKTNADTVTDNGTVAAVNFAALKVSSGIVGGVVGLSLAFASASAESTITWEDNSNGADALPTDQVKLIVFDTTTGTAVTLLDGVTRQNTTQVIQASGPIGAAPASMRVYAFFKRAANTAASPTSTALGHV